MISQVCDLGHVQVWVLPTVSPKQARKVVGLFPWRGPGRAPSAHSLNSTQELRPGLKSTWQATGWREVRLPETDRATPKSWLSQVSPHPTCARLGFLISVFSICLCLVFSKEYSMLLSVLGPQSTFFFFYQSCIITYSFLKAEQKSW